MPRFRAIITACVRSEASSFGRMLFMCVLTVPSEMASSAAISLFDFPAARPQHLDLALGQCIVGHVLGSEEQGHRQVLALSTATRHPGIAMAIASANFPDLRETAPAVLLYVLVSAIVTAPYFIWRKKSHAAATTPVTT